MGKYVFTAMLHREDDVWVALCPEVDIVSQGETLEDAKAHLREAVELFLESANDAEIGKRVFTATFISPLEVSVG